MYVTNLDAKNSKRTHWVSLSINKNTAVYFDSFEIEYIPQEVLNKIKDKSITHNISKLEDNECIMFLLYLFYKIYTCRKNFIILY